MATSTLEFDAPQGLTLTAELYTVGANGAALISAAATERTTDRGSYSASIVDIASGVYRLRIKNVANQTIARGTLKHLDAVITERPDDDRLWEMTEDDGGVRRLTANALELAPTGGGGSLTAADVWANPQRTLTQSAAQVAAIMSGTTITLLRGDTISFTLTGLGSLVGRSKLWISGKSITDLDDDGAEFRIEETAGLERIAGAAPSVSETATVTVNDAVAGNITVVLSASASKRLRTFERGRYDVQVLIAGVVTTKTAARLDITADATRAVA